MGMCGGCGARIFLTIVSPVMGGMHWGRAAVRHSLLQSGDSVRRQEHGVWAGSNGAFHGNIEQAEDDEAGHQDGSGTSSLG